MPELPEVETVMRQVRPHLEGRVVTAARAGWRRSLGGPTVAAFARSVVGARIAALRRRAKFIVVELDRQGDAAGAIVVHLRMTGRLQVGDAAGPAPRWGRVALDLDDGRRLDFVDPRKFGRFEFHRDPEERLAGLGPEPLGGAFTVEWLQAALAGRRRAVKPLLLDQGFVAGLGNIYVDESLHRARLHPETPAARVSTRKARALHGAIRTVLASAVEREGSSFDAFYRTPEGKPGSYQDAFRVYGRDGQPCRRCGARLRKIVVGQRGTHFCPRCQRKPR